MEVDRQMATTRTRRREVAWDEIARRAYEISQTDPAASPDENWLRAESELRSATTPVKRRSTQRANRVEAAA
jgi:hypothetical protein